MATKLGERDTDRYLKFHSETSTELGPGCYEAQSCFKSPKVNRATHATKRSPNKSPTFNNSPDLNLYGNKDKNGRI